MDLTEYANLVERMRAAQRRRTSYESVAEMRERTALEKRVDAATESVLVNAPAVIGEWPHGTGEGGGC